MLTASSEAELRAALARTDLDEYECEAYVAGPILRVDGLVAGGRLVFAKASRYANTCLDFAHVAPLGSFVIDDERLNRRVLAFTGAVLEALSLDGGAFHLELIVDERVESLAGRVPGLYREIVPGPGTVLDGNGGYDHIGGRFLFRGERSAEVESSIRLAIEAFRLECEPLPGPA